METAGTAAFFAAASALAVITGAAAGL